MGIKDKKRAVTVSFFLLFIAEFLYLGNLIIYEAVILAFGITETTQLLLLGVGLGFLTASFIAATIIGNFYYNVFTRAYYLLSAVWIGFFTYIFIASIIYDVMIAISQSFISIGPVLFWAALLVSMYGILHARKIIVTKIS